MLKKILILKRHILVTLRIIEKNKFALSFFHFLPLVDIEPDAINPGSRDVIYPVFFYGHISEFINVRVMTKKHDGFICIIEIFQQFENISYTGVI